jgi:threonine dehydrogenase-like Zn-dependent dehydrogenase
MRAATVTPLVKDSAQIVEVEPPRPLSGECLVRVLEVGIDGTDRDIGDGQYGEAPAGERRLVIGHESLGEVVDACESGDGPRPGDLVVATVRRPCPERCLNCRNAEYDFCTTGHYRERGIKQRHGYLAEYYGERPEFLVSIPPELRDVAVVLEPLSIVEKTFRQAYTIQGRMLWAPRRVVITGAGSVGTLAAFLARLRGLDTVVYSRGPSSGAGDAIRRQLGIGYVDSKEHPLADVADQHGAPDILIEATGYSPFAWQGAQVIATNGVAALLSVTNGTRAAEIPSDQLNTRFVLGNRLLFGSVNAHRRDFEQGVADLTAIRSRWPGALERFITHRVPLECAPEVLREKAAGELKVVIEVAASGGAVRR